MILQKLLEILQAGLVIAVFPERDRSSVNPLVIGLVNGDRGVKKIHCLLHLSLCRIAGGAGFHERSIFGVDPEQPVVDRRSGIDITQTKITDGRIPVQILLERIGRKISGDLVFIRLCFGKLVPGQTVVALLDLGQSLVQEPPFTISAEPVVTEDHCGTDGCDTDDRKQ